MSTIPLVMSPSGAVSTPPSDVRASIVRSVSATNPGYTANLPGTLIEDILSTDIAAISQCDQARVDAINSVSPYGANAFVLQQLGAQFGIAQGTPTNTSVLVVFSGTPGYIIPAGFIVSDGTNTYITQDGAVVNSSGVSTSVYCVASNSGTWAVPANTVTLVVSSVATGFTLTVTNPQDGIPGEAAETVDSYRGRVLQACSSIAQGVPSYLLTRLANVPGVNPRLVNILQASGGWEVICGGGDPVDVANAIFSATIDLSTIVGSATVSRNVSATIYQPPNTYTITYVSPPQQNVSMQVTWNTNISNFTASSLVNQFAATALINYINSIQVGSPINELEMVATFQSAVSAILPAQNITTLQFTVSINGVTTPPNAGTSIISGDPESYFYCPSNGVKVSQ